MKHFLRGFVGILILVAPFFCAPIISLAQLPDCNQEGYLYFDGAGGIRRWDPQLPPSSANPLQNTIFSGSGLAVCKNLNDPRAPSPTFYSIMGQRQRIWYHDGAVWVDTRHAIPTVGGLCGAGNYLYGFAVQELGIYKYDGKGDATLLVRIPDWDLYYFRSGGPLGIAGDKHGNVYILRTRMPHQWLRKYSSNGVLLKEWPLIGAPDYGGGAGMAIVCDELHYSNLTPGYSFGHTLFRGIITDTTVNITHRFVPFPQPFGTGDIAGCDDIVGFLSETGGPDTAVKIFRGCSSAFINFNVEGVDSVPYTFKLKTSGSAVNGVDYQYIDTIFTVGANLSDALLEIKALLVPNSSGPKEAVIQVMGFRCDAAKEEVLRKIKVTILDSLEVAITTPLDTVCPGTELEITAEIGEGLDFTWRPAYLIPDPTQLTIRPRPEETTTYSITVRQPGAPATCPSRTQSYEAVVEPYPEVLDMKDITVCLEDSIDLYIRTAQEDVAYQGLWVPSGYLRSPTGLYNKFYAPEGVYYKKVIVSSPAAGCTDTTDFTITVTAPFTFEWVSPDETIFLGDSIQLSTVSEAVRWHWSPHKGLNNPFSETVIARPKESTTYTVVGYGPDGCKDTAYIRVNVSYVQRFMVPNAFSPNGDGLNDVFRPEGIYYEKIMMFRVFDRWGNLVFETNENDKGWDGTYKGVACDAGVYFYHIQLLLVDNEDAYLKGDVSLIR